MAEQDAAHLGTGLDEAAGRKAAQQSFRKGGSRDPKVFVLLRELSEVHLLLDNVSANPNTTVSERTTEEKLKEQGLDNDWIEKICEISWPPDGSNEEKADDAALLIRAKDYLNRLSAPASGSTIAFTLLVTQGDARPRRSRLASLWRGLEEDKDVEHRPPTRRSLAEAAYPDLIGKAAGFRRAIWWISISLVFALLVTCAISWYVAYGNAALAELEASRTTLTKAQETIDQTETRPAPTTGQTAVAPAPSATPADPPAPYVSYCADKPYRSAVQTQLCNARDLAEAEHHRVERRVADWLCWDTVENCADPAKVPDAASRAAALATVMGTAVLPFLYGLLGAGAAIIRSLSRKIRASLLSPRDLHLSFQQLALGAVIGACIGLFVSAPGSDGDSILGPVTLSASAISFVAGFGVEAVFQAIEALITRIFNLTSATPTGNRGDGVAS
jgi:hypothetical protein